MSYKKYLLNLTKMPILNQDPLRYILKNKLLNDSGLVLEFGCWKGQTIDMISNFTTNNVYGFDTFEGIDYIWNEVDMKKFKLDNIPTKVQQLDFNEQYKKTDAIKSFNKNVKFIKGLFDDTLPNFMQENNKKISFIHVDCDLYESTKTIFKYCGKNIANNCIIVLDDLFNNKGFENHEIKAFYEWVNENDIKYEWIGSNSKVCTVDEINFIDSLIINKDTLNHERFPRFNDNRNDILFNDKIFLLNLKCQAVLKILDNPSLNI